MNDLATLTAQPIRLRLGGGEYDVYPLTYGDFGRIQAWIDAQFPDPFDVVGEQIAKGRIVLGPDGQPKVDESGRVVREPYPQGNQQTLYKLAMDARLNSKHLIGTPEGDAVFNSLACMMEMLYISLGKGDTPLSREEAKTLVDRLSPYELQRVREATNADMVTSGEAPKGDPGNLPDGTTLTETTPAGTTTLSSVSAGRLPKPRPSGGNSSTRRPKPATGRRRS